jgi:RNA 2',3'-cyclic 3'-phosphodiesterase
MAERARLFVAVIPPDEVLDAIAALARPDEPGVRYTTRDQWHVTLRFLGQSVVDDAVAALERVEATAVDVRLGPQVGRLGRNVLVIPAAGLRPVAAAVVAATAGVGEPPEDRRFAGHLTVARLKRRGDCSIAVARIVARFPAAEIHLVQSHLGRDGARYELIATQALAPSA